ncbi:hypothetical protein EWM64_g2092 [Hericium alpestre]|uniref:Ras GEF n=1 Tax=Hericium alpestre TaxID=135208 RepID=A0A4Z0A8K3_9AGAM|nr:hypothetical protein EWM64_g2092 [Hericium alpestre]
MLFRRRYSCALGRAITNERTSFNIVSFFVPEPYMATIAYDTHQSFAAASSHFPSTQASSRTEPDQQYIATFFCRALYDYQSADDSSLSFRKGDIIEVLTRLETGWWDGLLGDERGWFPSNYVVVISDEEADAVFSASDTSLGRTPAGQDSSLNMAQGSPGHPSVPSLMTNGNSSALADSRSQSDQSNWLEGDMEYEAARPRIDELATATMEGNSAEPNDFWVPQVTQDGQIFYVNTQTGQHSRDLPVEAEHDLSEDDFRGLDQPRRTRSTTTALYRQDDRIKKSSSSPAGFGPPRRSGTPEPWVRRLADDGMSYFYWNKLDGSVQWTLPEAASTSNGDRRNGPSLSDPRQSPAGGKLGAELSSRRLRSDSSVSNVFRGPGETFGGGYASAYSDDSDVDPLDRNGVSSSQREASNGRVAESRPALQRMKSQPLLGEQGQLTPAEEIAQALQQSLIPPAPESVNELSTLARQAVSYVTDFIRSHGVPAWPDQQRELEGRIHMAVVAIRNLLYISSPPYGHISSSLYPRDTRELASNSYMQSLQNHLKPAQRKVTATLSKLVLATLAANYDANVSSDASSRMEQDATELDRALLTFVLEVQRSNSQAAMQPIQNRLPSKRLRAALLPTGVGLGLIGSGAAGGWNGFGWVTRGDLERTPQRSLTGDILADMKSHSNALDDKLRVLEASLVHPAMSIRANTQSVIAWVQSFIDLVMDVNLAQSIDLDGFSREGQLTAGDAYVATLERARLLIRTLEVASQSLYDDCAIILLSLQSFDRHFHGVMGAEIIRSLAAPLRTNVLLVQQTMEALHSVGQEQASLGQNDYTGAIEWRMSRILSLENNLDQHLAALGTITDQPPDGEEEDVVDLEHALSKPAALKTSQSEGPTTAIYRRTSQSASSLEVPSTLAPENDTTPRTRTQHETKSSISSFTSPPSDAGGDTASIIQDDDDDALLGPSAAKSPSRADKLTRIFGEAPGHIIDQENAKAKPWYLRPTYSQAEILVDPDRKVRAGTVPALVERLTAHEHYSDTTFNKAFLLTYKSFTDTNTLFDLLVQRFWIKPPDKLNPQELEEWTKLKQNIIRMRVLNTFKTILLDDDCLEKEDMYILDRMRDFVQHEEVMHLAAAKQLLVLIERAQKGDTLKAKTTISLDAQPPAIVPRPSKKHKLLDFDPLEVARQLTMIECVLYQKIKASECLMRSREQRPGENNDNIAAIIETTNKIAHWVADTVLSKEDSRKRAAIVKQFILVADRCRNLHNFSSMIAIVSGLNSPPIRRLKRTWEQINQRYMTQLGACEMTIDSNKNFNNYRSLLARITPPCVPFVGVYLTTLTFIQDGAPNYVSGDLVNFRKRQKAAEVIDEIKKWQSKPFNFTKVDVIHDYIQESLNKFNDIPDVSDLFWNLSLEREPREREDEKMARLLQETGFL